MKINHPLMKNNFTRSDMNAVKEVINKKNLILTQSKNVKKFEEKWSKWLGVKYSTFVNSGASANFVTLAILKHSNKNKNRNEIIVPSLTWVSDISSVLMNGFKPVFVDANLENLSMSSMSSGMLVFSSLLSCLELPCLEVNQLVNHRCLSPLLVSISYREVMVFARGVHLSFV